MSFGTDGAGGPQFAPEAQAAFDDALNAHDRGDLQTAEAKYSEAVELDPRMTVAHNNLGMVLIQQDRVEEAVSSLRKASAIDPTYAEAYNNLGFAYRRLGQDLEAAKYYEKFLALVPDVEDASKIRDWVAKVRAEDLAAQSAEAPVPAPEEGASSAPPIAILPENPEGDAEESAAGPQFSELIDQDAAPQTDEEAGSELPDLPVPAEGPLPESPAAAGQENLTDSGLSSKAEEEFEAMFGSSDLGAESASGISGDGEDDEEVARLYTEAMTRFQDGDLNEAAHFCSQALERAPAHFATLLLAGRVSLNRQDYTRATALLQKAAEIKEDDPEVQYFLGQCYEKRGLLDEAQEVYKRCLELAPQGARADRLAKWLDKRRAQSSVSAGEVRCELCLRTYKEEELSAHEGRRVCNSCLETLGAKAATGLPVDDSAASPDRAEQKEEKAGGEQKPKIQTQRVKVVSGKQRGAMVPMLLALIVLGLGGYLFAGYFDLLPMPDAIAEFMGKSKPGPKPPVVTRPVPGQNNSGNPVNGTVAVKSKAVPKSMSFAPVADPKAGPLEEFSLLPVLTCEWPGRKSGKPKNAEEMSFELVKGPEGMTIDGKTGLIKWTPGLEPGIKLPSEHEVELKATCGKVMAQAVFKIKLEYSLGSPREIDLRLSRTYRATTMDVLLEDIDSDGRPDLAAVVGSPLSGQLTLLLSGGGSGEFNSTYNFPLRSAPIGIVPGDLDGDGRVDLCWANWVDGIVNYVRGTANTSISKPLRVCETGMMLDGVASADVNGDGKAEMVVLSRKSASLAVCGEKGLLARTEISRSGLPPRLFTLAANQAGRPALIGLASSGGTAAGEVQVYRMKGGSLLSVQKLELPAGVITSVSVGDFDGDGCRDAALAFGGQEGSLVVLSSDKEGKLSLKAPVSIGRLPVGLGVADLNGDGRDDAVVCSPDMIRYYLSNGSGKFVEVGISRLVGLAGPVAAWPSRDGKPGKVVALSLKGRAMVITPPPPARKRSVPGEAAKPAAGDKAGEEEAAK